MDTDTESSITVWHGYDIHLRMQYSHSLYHIVFVCACVPMCTCVLCVCVCVCVYLSVCDGAWSAVCGFCYWLLTVTE